MALLKSISFMIIFWAVTVRHFIAMSFDEIVCWWQNKPYTSDMAHLRGIKWGNSLFDATPGWSIHIEGRENLPQIGPYVLIANHESATDILSVYQLKINFRWFSKDSILRIPLIGRAMRLADYVPIKRGDKESHKRSLAESKRILREGTPVLFFPEGSRSLLGKPGKFKIGAFKVAIEENCPIVPIVLHGGGQLMRKHSLCPNPAQVTLAILPVQHHQEGESVVDYAQRMEQLIKDAHARIAQGASTLDDALGWQNA